MYSVDTLHSSDQAPLERGDWWRDLISSIHCPMAFSIKDSYQGTVERQRSDTYQLVGWTGEAETISRTAADIRRDPHGAYELVLPVKGEIVLSQQGTEAAVTPAGMALTSLDTVTELRHGDGFACVAFVIPRDRIAARIPHLPQTGSVLGTTSGLGRIIVDVVGSLRRERREITGNQFDALADRLVDLIALAHNADTATTSVAIQEGLATSVRRFVRENAHNPDLTGAMVAMRLGWSLRHVQAQLQRIGTTPSELIREERLALARLRLQDRSWRHQSVTQVAYSSGFGDLSTFSNAYRRAFGERPSDTRSAASEDN